MANIHSTNSVPIFDVYPSAFQFIEKPLYYSVKDLDKGSNDNFSTAVLFTKAMVISYLAWPIIMCAAPFTALIDVSVGIGEAFYAKYKNATSDQIILIIQKKIIASPLQHLVFITTNLALFFSLYHNTAVLLAPAAALPGYFLSQEIIRLLPTWARPAEFNIFINGGQGHAEPLNWWDRVEDEFNRWSREQESQFKRTNSRQKPQANIFNEKLCKKLREKDAIVSSYHNREFKDFFKRSLNKENTQKLLQLEDNFSEKELKAAYRKWALILHPDKHMEKDIKDVAEILFKEVLFKARLDLESKMEFA
ncbi:MAG: hypothetical protein C5B45_04070 [Chlamydiae bacterium]|nr:MAG: hypothetical protein C5B45_04070 [Chlamydiota bacterium]